MKQFSGLLIVLFTFLSTLVAEDLSPVVVNIDETKVIKSWDAGILGITFDQNADQSLVSPTDTNSPVCGLRDEIIELVSGFPIDLARCTISTGKPIPWKDRIGPLGQRPPQKLAPWDTLGPKNFGLVEQLYYLRSLDKKTKIAWIVNLLDDPQDVADLAEFLCASATAKPRGKTNWAARRVLLGVVEPFDVIWELGNEADNIANSADYPSFQSYVYRCRVMIDAIRSVVPNAKFAAQASSMQGHVYKPDYQKKYGGTWQDFHRTVLRELGDQIDYITTHTYFGKSGGTYMPGFQWENRQNSIINDIKSITKTNRIKIYNSEYGVMPEKKPGQSNVQQALHDTHSLAGCLAVSDWIVRNINNPDVAIATMHCFSSGPWGVYRSAYNDASGKYIPCAPYLTGLHHLFKMIKQGTADARSVVAFTVSGDSTDSRTKEGTFIASCIKTRGGLTLFLVNRDPESERELAVNTKLKYSLESWQTLSGASLESRNEDKKKEIVVEQHTGQPGGAVTKKMRIPAKSILVVMLRRL
ncbi:MAG: hypothetical protein HZC28_03050 [Spirochaetes bacterium]|nr:hypothetical protein [Spirochaetota bacterium]